MFTPKNIQGALEELYDLCDPDYMVDMLVNYSEEFDDISPALLAKSFQKNAEMISEYRVLSSAGEGIDYQGKVLLNSRAVRLLSYVEDMSGDEKVRTIQSKELWLAEDMTFYVVSCMSTITMDKEEAICLNEHRSVVTTVECEDDIFFDMGSLICELDDICLFELLADVDPQLFSCPSDSPEQSVSQLSPVGFADWYSLRRRTSAGCLSKRQKRKEVPTQC